MKKKSYIVLPMRIVAILFALLYFICENNAAYAGTLWAWGSNLRGQLGDGTEIDRLTPVRVNGMIGVTEVAIGDGYCIALKADGTVWGWGRIDMGHWMKNVSYGLKPSEVENITMLKKAMSYFRPRKLTNVIAITSGYYHALALKNDGSVWAWGRCDAAWRWGDKYQKASHTPYQLEELNDIIDFSDNGGNFMLKKDGRVLVSAYGFKQVEQLKDVVKVADDIVLKSDGTIWTIKYDFNRDIQKMIITASLLNRIYNVVDIASGFEHFLALTDNGSVWAWGKNKSSQLGDDTTVEKKYPVKVNAINDVNKISAGASHSLALKKDGTVWAWGNNFWGQLGDGTKTDRHIPVQVKGLKAIKTICAGLSMSLAIKE